MSMCLRVLLPLTLRRKCLLCNNNSQIPDRILWNILRIIEARSSEVLNKWTVFFGETQFYH